MAKQVGTTLSQSETRKENGFFVTESGVNFQKKENKLQIQKNENFQEERELDSFISDRRYKLSDADYFKNKLSLLIEKSKKSVKYEEERLLSINEESGDLNFEDLARNQMSKKEIFKDLRRAKLLLRYRVNAKNKIENNTFGICYITGEYIEFQRLDLTPHCTTSLKGMKIKEKQKN